MIKITNTSDISLPLAVWVLHDEYDYIDDPAYISVTTLMRPLRQIVLPSRIPPDQRQLDVEDFIASAMGKSLHDSIEKAWTFGYKRSLKLLGYPDDVIDRILINPFDDQLIGPDSIADPIPVFLEQRAVREINVDGQIRKVGGKYDMVADWIVQDNKSTSAWAWVAGTRDDDHRLQMSLYRWIDAQQPVPKIREDFGIINYIFTDWSKMLARTNPKYPDKRVEKKIIQLMSVDETEQWVRNKLRLVHKYFNTPEADIPHCTDEELWRSEPVYKYYADPAKISGRATKNFDNYADAQRHQAEKGKGLVITKPGEPKRCSYCPAFEGCTQKDAYL